MGTDEAPPALGYRTVLRNRQYLLWLASADAASVGYSVYAISIVWLSYVSFHSYAIVGLVLFVEYASYASTFLVGPIVDRVSNQRSIYLVCYPLQAVTAVVLGLATTGGFLSIPLLLVLVVAISVLWDFGWAAGQAAPGILLNPQEQFAAGGVAGAIGGANSIAGYATGGVLILITGASGGLYLYGALLALAALLATGLRIHPKPDAEVGFGQSFREGWAVVGAGPGRPLLQLAFVDALQAFFTTGTALLITLVSFNTFAGSGSAYGVLFTIYVVGGVVAELALGWLNPRGRAGLVMLGSLLAGGLAFAIVGVLPPLLVLTAVLWLLIGMFSSGYTGAKYAYLRGSVSPNKLGRVTANLYLFPGISSAVGAVALGVLAGSTSPTLFGLLVGVGLLSAGVLATVLPGVKVLRY